MKTKAGLGPEAIAPILVELKAGLQEIYGPRLRDVILFGSYARGEAEPDSDIDVAVVLDEYADSFEEIARTSRMRAGVCLDHGRLVSLFYVRDRDLETPLKPVHSGIRREGVSA